MKKMLKPAYLIGRLKDKYRFEPQDYDYKMINEIIYNDKSHFVALFKEYLILDDNSEFLKRFYSKQECQERVPKITSFYESYTKIFANYTAIKESKFLYENIRKKQINLFSSSQQPRQMKMEELESYKGSPKYEEYDSSNEISEKNVASSLTILDRT